LWRLSRPSGATSRQQHQPCSYVSALRLAASEGIWKQGSAEYIDWLAGFAREIHRVLKDDDSFVLDFGGSYEKGTSTRSLYNFKTLIKFCDELGFFLAEDFYWFIPPKLPSPVEWVNKRKITGQGCRQHDLVVQQDRVAESRYYKGSCPLQQPDDEAPG